MFRRLLSHHYCNQLDIFSLLFYIIISNSKVTEAILYTWHGAKMAGLCSPNVLFSQLCTFLFSFNVLKHSNIYSFFTGTVNISLLPSFEVFFNPRSSLSRPKKCITVKKKKVFYFSTRSHFLFYVFSSELI